MIRPAPFAVALLAAAGCGTGEAGREAPPAPTGSWQIVDGINPAPGRAS